MKLFPTSVVAKVHELTNCPELSMREFSGVPDSESLVGQRDRCLTPGWRKIPMGVQWDSHGGQ